MVIWFVGVKVGSFVIARFGRERGKTIDFENVEKRRKMEEALKRTASQPLII